MCIRDRHAVAHCVAYHDGLRSRFEEHFDGWRVVVSDPDDEAKLEVIPQSEDMHEQLETWHSSFDVRGQLVRFLLLEPSGSGGPQLMVIAHHLVVDNVSWSILLEDLDLACHQIRSQEPINLPAKSMSMLDWSRQLTEYAQAETTTRSTAYWQELAGHSGAVPRDCLLYTSPSPRDQRGSRMPSSA